MASNKYIKTKSNYIFRSQHQKTTGGTVFERDFMTVSTFDGMSPSEKQVYGLNNFKFQVRSGLNEQKKHNNGKWIPDTSVTGGTVDKKDKDTRTNPDYESMREFAYYGSAVNLVKASIIDIILNFPAELYFTENVFPGVVNGGAAGATYYMVSNDYDIDVITEDVDEEEVDNTLRYLAKSLGDYVVYPALNTAGTATGLLHEVCPASIEITHYNKSCEEINSGAIIAESKITLDGNENSGDKIVLYTYQVGENRFTLYTQTSFANYRIRPNKEISENFFDNLNDFERVLLNRDTNPVYMATFNTPYETEKGFFTYKQNYIWPTTYGWNPDITTPAYEKYVEDLISLASYHDEYDSDNIWRSMTHEAIKNLDWTFTREKGDDVTEFETVDTTKIEPILKLYGRQYDDLKRYIDAIAKSGNVTYNKKNNIPDKLLGSVLDSLGWEISAVNTMIDDISVPYSGGNILFDKSDVNNEFFRRLRVNSSYLQSMRGTKKGLVSVLGLFGLEENTDYKINEYIAIAKQTPGSTSESTVRYPLYQKVAGYNKRKYNFDVTADDALYGLSVKMIPYQVTENAGTSAETLVDYSYVVPWYENGRTYDNGLYFQMNGGWGKTDKMKVNNTNFSEFREYITSDSNFQIFNETISDLKYAQTLDDMLELGRSLVKTGDVCYVTDLGGFAEKYNPGPDTAMTPNVISHYFYLENDDYAGTLGYEGTEYLTATTETRGWTAVKQADLENPLNETKEVKKVLYLESIIDETRGNNPHMGHSSYDSGSEYMETMITPFGPTISEGNFETLSDDELNDVSANCSFTSAVNDRKDGVIDNKKCWYFADRLRDLPYSAAVTCDTKVREITAATTSDTGSISIDNTKETTGATVSFTANTTTMEPFNPEGRQANDIAAANSIINSKRLSITFIEPQFIAGRETQDRKLYEDFITNKVLFYLKQVIPSTTLFEYNITVRSN